MSYRVYETEAGERKLTFESALPSVFFSTSAWEPTLVEIVSVDATGAETFVWPPFSQGITMDVFDQLLAVGEDDLGPVLQIRDCVQEASVTDHDPALAVRSLRVPGATELRGLAVAHERREAFLRAADRIFVLRHFTTAGSKRDETGAVRLDLGEVATSAPLGVGGALAFGNDTLYAADGAVLVRIELGSNGWHETARSAPLEYAIQQLEVVGSQIEIVVDVGATKRLLHATWPPTGLVLGEATAIPLTGPVVTASPDRGSNASDLYFAELGGTEILHANGNRVLTSPFGITALSAESKRVYVRDAEGRVSSWSLAGEDAAAFRMPAARVHAQRMLEGLSVIIE